MTCGKKNNFCSNKLFYTNPFASTSGGGAIITDEEMIIASLENVNLKTIAANVLTWASGKTAANTAPTRVVITMAENDTYADNTTSLELQMDGSAVTDIFGNGIQNSVQNLDSTKTISTPLTPVLFSNSGDWSFPVTTGTLNDFRVNIYILGQALS